MFGSGNTAGMSANEVAAQQYKAKLKKIRDMINRLYKEIHIHSDNNINELNFETKIINILYEKKNPLI